MAKHANVNRTCLAKCHGEVTIITTTQIDLSINLNSPLSPDASCDS